MIRGARPAHNLVKVHGYLHIDENSENQSPGGNNTLPNLSYVVLDPNRDQDKAGKQKNVENLGGKQRNVENMGGKNHRNVEAEEWSGDHRSPGKKTQNLSDHKPRGEHHNLTTSSHDDISHLNHSIESNQSEIIDVTEDLYHTPPHAANDTNKPVSVMTKVIERDLFQPGLFNFVLSIRCFRELHCAGSGSKII